MFKKVKIIILEFLECDKDVEHCSSIKKKIYSFKDVFRKEQNF